MRTRKAITLLLALFVLGLIGNINGQSITVTSPETGAAWCKGNAYNINWTKSGDMQNLVKIRLFNEALTMVILPIGDHLPNNGTHNWTVPGILCPGTYRIRVRTMDNAVYGDGGAFTISDCAAAATITVTSPHSASIFYKDWMYNPITWTKAGAMDGNVKIRLYDTSGITMIHPVVDSTPNNGSYSWTAPNSIPDGNYIIRVRTLDNAVFHDSNAFQLLTVPNSVAADLYMKLMKANPITPTIKDSIRIFFIIKNIGNARIEATKAHLRINKEKNGVSVPVSERFVDIFALDPGKEFSGSLIIGKISTPGLYSVWIKVNRHVHFPLQPESNYQNNMASIPITVLGVPDLIVCHRDYDIQIGVKKKMFAMVKNIGSKRSAPCKLSFGLTDKGVQLLDVPALDPGRSVSLSRDAQYATQGTRRLVLVVDPSNQVDELNEDNNKTEGRIKVHIMKPRHHSAGYNCSDGSRID